MQNDFITTEKHPLRPFLPGNANILMLGSFPPKQEKWSMDFFYPNWINDMWRITGLIFFEDKNHFIKSKESGELTKGFDKERITDFCCRKGIALYDAAQEVRRLKDNASDKFLEVVKATDLEILLADIKECKAIVTTGQKATDIIVETFGCETPAIGQFTEINLKERTIRFWRMPSSSRAYPLSLENKSRFYKNMYEYENIL